MQEGLVGVRRLLEEEFFDRFGLEAEVPEVVPVSDAPEEEFLREGYSPGFLEDGKLYVNEDFLRDEDLGDHVKVWANMADENAMGEVFENTVEEVADGVGVKPEGPFAARYSPVLVGGASYTFSEGVMKNGFNHRGKTPPGSGSLVDSSMNSKKVRHEAAHAVQDSRFEFSGYLGLVLMKTDDKVEYAYHPDIATIETLPRFEEDPEGRGAYCLVESRLGDKWQVPDLLAQDYFAGLGEHPRVNGGGGFEMGDHLYSDPYAMAEVIAYTVKNHFKRAEHVDDPVDETRKALYDIVADAERWEEMMEGIWEDWGVPNYHDLFRENYTRIQNDPVYAKDEMNRLEEEMRDMDGIEPDLEVFYEAKSFVHAYRASGREEPDSLDQVETLADTRALMRPKIDGVKIN